MKKTFKLIGLGFILTLASCNGQESLEFSSIYYSSSEESSSSSSESSSSYSSSLSSSYSSSSSLADLINPTKVKVTNKDYNPSYSPCIGKQNILVIPISLAGNTAYEWTDELIQDVNGFFFKTSDTYVGDNLYWYYNSASQGRLEIGGKVTSIYHSDYIRDQLYTDNADNNTKAILDIMCKAIDYASNEVNLDDYDSDDDGYIDSVHFIFDETDGGVWDTTLWPQMEFANLERGTKEKPQLNAYSSTNLGHFNSSRTAIHEQGHIFGLEDYYNYDSKTSDADFLGHGDMQGLGYFDWNSFSKMTTGWADPYYVDGSKGPVTINLHPSATTNECILVSNSWNESAFDEYILIELFSPLENNLADWYPWGFIYNSLGNGGIRLYHVDARLWGFDEDLNDGEYISSPKDNTHSNLQLGCNNSLNDTYEFPSPEVNKNYQLLDLIQATNVNTFADPSTKSYLGKDDLFHTGDYFTLEKYGENFFYNKTTLDNGQQFPFRIDFDSVTMNEATIRISLI